MKIFKLNKFSCNFDDIMKDEKYKNIEKEMEKIKPSVDFQASWILDYMQKNFSYLVNDIEFLDKKADSLIKYLGLGTGGIGIFLSYLYMKLDLSFIISIIILVGIVFWIASILHALLIRLPTNTFYPPTITSLFQIENEYRIKGISLFAAILGYEKAISALRIIGERIAKRLQLAYIYLMISIFLFFIPLIVHFIFK